MGMLSRLFNSSKFNDAQLVSQAETAIATDPMVSDLGSLVVTSKNGVITLSGLVKNPQEKDRIEGVVRNALTTRSMKHERIVNDIRLPNNMS